MKSLPARIIAPANWLARRCGTRWGLVLSAVCVAGVLAVTILSAPLVRDLVLWFRAATAKPVATTTTAKKAPGQPSAESIANQIASLKRQCRRYIPSAAYLIVSTSDNKFSLRKDTVVLRNGVCSTGSYTLLRSLDKGQEWIFTTPRGRLRVERKEESPVWDMPDWAFVEEGRPIPPRGSPERRMPGVLGDYALHLGNGYMVHGTLYQRFLGLAVTHGCVRLGDDDLKAVFEALSLSARVYLY